MAMHQIVDVGEDFAPLHLLTIDERDGEDDKNIYIRRNLYVEDCFVPGGLVLVRRGPQCEVPKCVAGILGVCVSDGGRVLAGD